MALLEGFTAGGTIGMGAGTTAVGVGAVGSAAGGAGAGAAVAGTGVTGAVAGGAALYGAIFFVVPLAICIGFKACWGKEKAGNEYINLLLKAKGDQEK